MRARSGLARVEGSRGKAELPLPRPVDKFIRFLTLNLCGDQKHWIRKGHTLVVLSMRYYKQFISTEFRYVEVEEFMKDFNGFDLVAYNCLISANVERGNLDKAHILFDELPEKNEVSWTAIVSGLKKHGRVEEAIWYFERNPIQNLISWTAAISGLVQNGLSLKALNFFLRMLASGFVPNDVTFTSVPRASGALGDIGLGMSILGLIVKVGFENHVSVLNSLITLNLRLGEVDLARKIFDQMEERDVVSWTAILDVYVELGNLREARRVFDMMPEGNEVSWSAMIARYNQSGHARLEDLKPGMSVHGYVVKIGSERNIFVSSSLIDLYCKCAEADDGRKVFDSILEKNVMAWNSMVGGYRQNGKMEEALVLFQQIPEKNNVSWNTIIAGYLQNDQCDKVFEIFNGMLSFGESPSASTFCSVLCGCATIAWLEKGKILHGKTIKRGVQYDIYVGTALTDMYAKSGDINSAREIFNRMPEKNEICWTVMIQGLAENGFAGESLMMFEEMERSTAVAPNELMLLTVLFACSHCVLVDGGLSYFNSMEKIYGIKPMERHFTCVVDLLSRSGRLSQAEEFINSMPIQPESNAWAALLSGCFTHKNEEITERTAIKLRELADYNSAPYVLLSNINAFAGKWIDVSNIGKAMRDKGLKKFGGYSWIEVKELVHCFCSGDRSHPQSTRIYELLDLLWSDMFKLSDSIWDTFTTLT
ncbi:Pentatricopeptide repeat [Dillenia turbinata]|uniref:Pentatricopeptide repeat n=1 Tax=Dillenia turbinata TaxID=194707 RepID=A0AAN8V7T0_9MAGN